MAEQPTLFQQGRARQTTNCDRCNVRLQIATERNGDGKPIRRSLTERGYCPNCAVTEFILGTEPLKTVVTRDRADQFPEAFRLEHVQVQFRTMLEAGGAGEVVAQLDWDEVIANWALPFPQKIQGYG